MNGLLEGEAALGGASPRQAAQYMRSTSLKPVLRSDVWPSSASAAAAAATSPRHSAQEPYQFAAAAAVPAAAAPSADAACAGESGSTMIALPLFCTGITPISVPHPPKASPSSRRGSTDAAVHGGTPGQARPSSSGGRWVEKNQWAMGGTLTTTPVRSFLHTSRRRRRRTQRLLGMAR